MDRRDFIKEVESQKIIAILRGMVPAEVDFAIEVLKTTSLRIVEITMDTPGATDMVREYCKDEEIIMGMGTITCYEELEKAFQAGAKFIVTPILSMEVLLGCREAGVPLICGALTPSEIMIAWQGGADLVKVFPASALGPSYIKDVLGPLAGVKLIPTGGINISNGKSYLEAGAIALGIGGSLFNRKALDERDTETQREYLQSLITTIKGY